MKEKTKKNKEQKYWLFVASKIFACVYIYLHYTVFPCVYVPRLIVWWSEWFNYFLYVLICALSKSIHACETILPAINPVLNDFIKRIIIIVSVCVRCWSSLHYLNHIGLHSLSVGFIYQSNQYHWSHIKKNASLPSSSGWQFLTDSLCLLLLCSLISLCSHSPTSVLYLY